MNPSLPYSIQTLGRLSPGIRQEIETVISSTREFNEKCLRALACEIDMRVESDPDYLSQELLVRYCDAGFFSRWIPKVFGGQGLTPFSMLSFSEELGSECLGAAHILGAHLDALSLLSATLNAPVLKKLTREILEGEKSRQPCVLSVAHLQETCLARRVEGGYRLSGSKIFVSNGRIAAYHILVAASGVILAVRAGSEGLRLGRRERKMGQRASTACELIFEDCFVPDERVALAPEQYDSPDEHAAHTKILMDDVLSMSQAGVAAVATGAARSAFEKALSHSKRSKLDGKPLADHPWVQDKLTRMQKNVALLRLAYTDVAFSSAVVGTYRKAYGSSRFLSFLNSNDVMKRLRKARVRKAQTHQNSELSALGSMAKFAATDLAMENVRLALEIMGTAGLRQSEGLEKILRDCQRLQISQSEQL
jgi:alkylation response protein AidB-like acyl-CoA dehydrogenase